MAFSRKKEKRGRVVTLKIIGALCGIAVGVVIAAVWLVFKPVAIADAPPKDEGGEHAPHSVTYVRGRESPVSPSRWRARQRAFLRSDPRGVELREQDLNRWFATEFAGTDRATKWDAISSEFSPGLPLFRFDGDVVEVGTVNKLNLMDSIETSLVVQAKGSFERHGKRFLYVPKELLIGSCPVPTGFLRGLLFNAFAGGFALPDPTAEAWATINDITVEQSRMKLGFAPPPPQPPITPEIEPEQEAPAAVAPNPVEMVSDAAEGASNAAPEAPDTQTSEAAPEEQSDEMTPAATESSLPEETEAPAAETDTLPSEAVVPVENPAPTGNTAPAVESGDTSVETMLTPPDESAAPAENEAKPEEGSAETESALPSGTEATPADAGATAPGN